MQHDLADLLILLNDPNRQGDFLPFDMWSQTRMQEQFVKDGFWDENNRRLVIVDDDNQIIGMIWIFPSVPYFDALELGYRLFDRERWGQGIMTEAMALTIDFVFASLKVRRLEVRCDVANRASIRVAEKLGFVHEGTARKASFSRGQHRDMHLFGLLRDDWTPNSSTFVLKDKTATA